MQDRTLLLISSSRSHPTGLFEHCAEAISRHFADAGEVVFVPYALADHAAYETKIAERFRSLGVPLQSIHRRENPAAAISSAGGIFIGGGNSFRLLKTLYDLNLLGPIRQAVSQGVPYMGSSAGTNMACPTIRTTNDMPIVEPPSLAALHLIPFQINPHFLDADPDSCHQGETRAQRLAEFHEENSIPVAALREGSWLEISGDACTLRGATGMMLFQQGQPPQEIEPESNLDCLLQQAH